MSDIFPSLVSGVVTGALALAGAAIASRVRHAESERRIARLEERTERMGDRLSRVEGRLRCEEIEP